MPYDVFWHGEPSLYSNYLEAYEKKQKDEDKAFAHRENFKAWLNGFYMDIALSCNHPLAKQKKPYIEEPIKIGEEKDEVHEDTEELTKQEEQAAIAQFMAFGQFAEAFNKKRKENGK